MGVEEGGETLEGEGVPGAEGGVAESSRPRFGGTLFYEGFQFCDEVDDGLYRLAHFDVWVFCVKVFWPDCGLLECHFISGMLQLLLLSFQLLIIRDGEGRDGGVEVLEEGGDAGVGEGGFEYWEVFLTLDFLFGEMKVVAFEWDLLKAWGGRWDERHVWYYCAWPVGACAREMDLGVSVLWLGCLLVEMVVG